VGVNGGVLEVDGCYADLSVSVRSMDAMPT